MSENGEEHLRRLERMYAAAPVNRFYEPRITVGPGVAELRLALRPDFHHAAGAAHGSVLFKLLDDAAYFAVASRVPDVFVVTATFEVRFVRPAAEGTLVATGRVLEEAGRRFRASAEVRDPDGRLVAAGEGTFARSRTPLSAELGYR